jgi:hypothetical protein
VEAISTYGDDSISSMFATTDGKIVVVGEKGAWMDERNHAPPAPALESWPEEGTFSADTFSYHVPFVTTFDATSGESWTQVYVSNFDVPQIIAGALTAEGEVVVTVGREGYHAAFRFPRNGGAASPLPWSSAAIGPNVTRLAMGPDGTAYLLAQVEGFTQRLSALAPSGERLWTTTFDNHELSEISFANGELAVSGRCRAGAIVNGQPLTGGMGCLHHIAAGTGQFSRPSLVGADSVEAQLAAADGGYYLGIRATNDATFGGTQLHPAQSGTYSYLLHFPAGR